MRSRPPVAHPNPELINPWGTAFDVASVSEDGLTVRIEFLEGVAGQLRHIDVDENAQRVRISVFLGMTQEAVDFASKGGMFTSQGFPKVAEVRLKNPLRGREIVDGQSLQN